jgi:phage terminase large subunit-like protein
MELFNETRSIVQFDERLRKRLTVREYKGRIVNPNSSSVYVAVAADGDALHGKTPNVVIKDELHAWTGSRGMGQYQALTSALVKVPNTLDITLTTSGRGQENIAWREIEYAMRVQKGQLVDPATLPVLFMTEPEDDWADPEIWEAVNPGMKHGYPDKAGFYDAAKKAENNPSDRDSFRQYNLNMWLDASTSPFVEMYIYDRGAHEIDLDDLELTQAPCYIGVDLSKNEDLTAVVCAFRVEGGGYHIQPYFFCPEDNLRARGDRHGVDYVTWAEDGFIMPTEGNTVDLRAVERFIRELCARFNVKEIAFDPTFGRSMMADLTQDGLPAVEFRQGWVSMGPAVKELERVILSGQLMHGGHPVLRWNFENVQVETDKAGVRMFHKARSGNKIDGAVACAMAVARAAAGGEKFITSADWFTPDMWMA